MGAQKMALAENELAQNTALKTRGLDLHGRQLEHNISQDVTKQIDAQIANYMGVAAETIKAGLEGGADPAKLKATVAPLLQAAQSFASRAGRDPNALAAQLDAQLTNPTPVARAAVKGRSEGVQRVEQERAIQQQPEGTRVEISPYKTPEEKVKLENALRDDYVKQSKDFVIQRDFMDRIQTSPATGAGDIGLVFSYMKVLDPTSTVREGEFATASNSGGVSEGVRALYNKLVGGGVISEATRKDIKDTAGKYFSQSASRHNTLTQQFADIAKRTKLDPRNIIVDFTTAGGSGQAIPPPPPGYNRVGQ